MSVRSSDRGRRTDAIEVFGSSEVLTSSEFQKRLTDQGMSKDAARQAMRRAVANGQGLWRSLHLRLPRGERLFARRSFVSTKEFYERAAHRVQEFRPGLARCLNELSRGTVLNRVQAQRLVAAPMVATENTSSPAFEAELVALRELGVRTAGPGTPHEYLLGGGRGGSPETDRLALESLLSLRKECVLARVLSNRLRVQNAVSWTGCNLPQQDKGYVEYNGQIFSATGFSYLAPLVRTNVKNKLVPCPVLIDVFAGCCTLPMIQAFVDRAEKVSCRGRTRTPFLGVIGARDFDQDAWKVGRTKGLLTVNLVQMFGDEALNSMALVERLLGGLRSDQFDERVCKEFLSFAKSLEELKNNPVVADLCSIGFEILAGFALRSEGFESVVLGQDVPFKGDRTRDVDVFGRRGDEFVMLECKAYNSRKVIDPSEVTKFFTETVPACRTWWASKEKRQMPRCRAEIWTCGEVGEAALDTLRELSLKQDVVATIRGPREIAALLPSDIRNRGMALIRSISDEKVYT